jgi:hypothetical protein
MLHQVPERDVNSFSQRPQFQLVHVVDKFATLFCITFNKKKRSLW